MVEKQKSGKHLTSERQQHVHPNKN